MNKFIFILALTLLFSCKSGQQILQDPAKRVLVFTKTLGWRHQSIETGVDRLKAIGKQHGLVVQHTEDAAFFHSDSLKKFQVVVFLNTTGNVLDNSQQEAFEQFIRNGGSYMGVHAAADTEYEWEWYGNLVGGYFESHPNNPNIREATLHKTEHVHPSTMHLPASFERNDEWYNYKSMSSQITPVLLLDESTYEGGTQGDYHPIAWYHEYEGGKAFYTGGGHTQAAYQDPDFSKHLEQALLWCLQ